MEEPRTIAFLDPATRAWQRMVAILFRPFDLGKWFVLGFTAWLATLSDGGGGGGGSIGNEKNSPGETASDLWESLEPGLAYIRENLSWILPLALLLLVLLIALFVVFLWLSSRGKFMFLDNVVHNRALVAEPWRTFRHAGNSLFRWRLVFSLVAGLLFASILGVAAWYLVSNFDQNHLSAEWIALFVGSLWLILTLSLALWYVLVLLEDFVIPTMYRHSLTANAAWKRILSLHRGDWGYFLVYFLWRCVLGIGAVIGVVAAVLATCCCAALILLVPYLGTVLLLPILVFFRSLGPEFLRQFGDDCDVWHGLTLPAPPPQSPPAPPSLPPRPSPP